MAQHGLSDCDKAAPLAPSRMRSGQLEFKGVFNAILRTSLVLASNRYLDAKLSFKLVAVVACVSSLLKTLLPPTFTTPFAGA